MAHYFRVIYRTQDDGRRTTRFFEAESYPEGFKVYFPPDFTADLPHVESVALFDEDKMPKLPDPHE